MAAYCFILILLLACLPHSLADTHYVSQDTIIVAQSVPDCQIFGDPDLFGLGIRISVYLQFLAGLLGVAVGVIDEMRSSRVAFNVTFTALLIVIIKEAIRDSFTIFEWSIISQWLFVVPPVFIPVQIFLRQAGREATQEKDRKKLHKPLPKAQKDTTCVKESSTHGSPTPEGGVHRQRKVSKDLQVARRPVGQGAIGVAAAQTPRVRRVVSESDISHVRVQEKRPVDFFGPKAGEFRGPDIGEDGEQERLGLPPGYKLDEEYVRKITKDEYRPYLTDASGWGIFLILLAAYIATSIWIYWWKYDSGHREHCLVRVRFFGVINMYSIHWKRWMRASSIIGIPVFLVLLPGGIWMLWRGSMKWQEREEALRRLDEKELFFDQMQVLWRKLQTLNQHRDKITDQRDWEVMEEGWHKTVENIVEECGRRVDAAEYSLKELIEMKERAIDLKRTAAGMTEVGKVLRLSATFIMFAIGAIAIANIETTITQLNPVDMDDIIANKTGQLLALLMGVFSILGFLIEAFQSFKKEAAIDKRMSSQYQTITKHIDISEKKAKEDIERHKRIEGTSKWLLNRPYLIRDARNAARRAWARMRGTQQQAATVLPPGSQQPAQGSTNQMTERPSSHPDTIQGDTGWFHINFGIFDHFISTLWKGTGQQDPSSTTPPGGIVPPPAQSSGQEGNSSSLNPSNSPNPNGGGGYYNSQDDQFAHGAVPSGSRGQGGGNPLSPTGALSPRTSSILSFFRLPGMHGRGRSRGPDDEESQRGLTSGTETGN